MKSRTKLTPFARFFLFLIIILPLAYLGAAYFNGEDPVAKIKDLVNKTEESDDVVEVASSKTADSSRELITLQQKNQQLEEKVKKLEKEIETLKEGTKRWGK